MKKSLLIYGLMILIFGISLVVVLRLGSHLQPTAISQRVETSDVTTSVTNMHLRESLLVLLLQIVVIIIIARVTGYLFRKMGQPAVIGEMTAGILLGPS